MDNTKNEEVNNSRSISHKVNIAEALKLRLVNKLSYQTIADRYGVSKPAVFQALKRFLNILAEPDELEAYKNYKVDLLSSVELKLLERLVNDDVMEKASLNNIAYAFQNLFNANRLEAGKSTGNINIAEVNASIDDLQRQAKELRKTL